MAERVEAIAAVRLQGKVYPEIAEYCGRKGLPCGCSQVYVYIRRTDAVLAQSVEQNRHPLIGQRIVRRDLLWTRALEKDDLRMALAVEKDQTKLLGLYPERPAKPGPAPTQVQVNNGTPASSEEDR
jgi:hypothetical protein